MLLVTFLIFVVMVCSLFYLLQLIAGSSGQEWALFSVTVLAFTAGFMCSYEYYVEGAALKASFRKSQLRQAQETVESYRNALDAEVSK